MAGGAGDGSDVEKRRQRQARHRELERQRRQKTQNLLAEIMMELELKTGERQPTHATINKTLNHVVSSMQQLRAGHVETAAVAATPVSSEPVAVRKKKKTKEKKGGLACAGQTDALCALDADLTEIAIKAAAEPIAFVCMDGGIIDTNLAFSAMLGYEQGQLRGNTVYMHAAPVAIAPLMSAVCELITGRPFASCKIQMQHKAGHAIMCSLDMAGHRVSADKMFIVIYAQQLDVVDCGSCHPVHVDQESMSIAGSALSRPACRQQFCAAPCQDYPVAFQAGLPLFDTEQPHFRHQNTAGVGVSAAGPLNGPSLITPTASAVVPRTSMPQLTVTVPEPTHHLPLFGTPGPVLSRQDSGVSMSLNSSRCQDSGFGMSLNTLEESLLENVFLPQQAL